MLTTWGEIRRLIIEGLGEQTKPVLQLSLKDGNLAFTDAGQRYGGSERHDREAYIFTPFNIPRDFTSHNPNPGLKAKNVTPFEVVTAIKKGTFPSTDYMLHAPPDVRKAVTQRIGRRIAMNYKNARIMTVVCADSRSPMASDLAQIVAQQLGARFVDKNSGGLRKNDAANWQINWQRIKDEGFYDSLKDEIPKVMEKLKSLNTGESDVASIADDFPPRWREYLTNVHSIGDPTKLKGNVLVVDDNVDSATTFNDIVDNVLNDYDRGKVFYAVGYHVPQQKDKVSVERQRQKERERYQRLKKTG